MMFRRFILAASVSLLSLSAQAGTVTFDTTNGTLDLGDGNSDFFGNPTVTTENGVRVFTFDEVVMNSDTINVIGNAPLVIRSRTNMLVINTNVNVLPGNAGGGASGTGGDGGTGGSGGDGGAGGDGGSGSGPEFAIGKTGDDGTEGGDGFRGSGGTDGGEGFGGIREGSGSNIAGSRQFGEDGGSGGSGGFRVDSTGDFVSASDGTAGVAGDDGGDGGKGFAGVSNASGRALTAGSGGGAGAGGAGGAGGSGGGGGGGGSENVGFPFQPNGVDGGPGGDGGNGAGGGDGGDGGAGGGAVAFEALGFMRVFDSVLSANAENGEAGVVTSTIRDRGDSGLVVNVNDEDRLPGGAGGKGGDGGLGGNGGDGAGGGGGTVKLSASVLELNPGIITPTEVSTLAGSGGGTDGPSGGQGRFLVESNIDVDLNNIVQTGTRTETFTGPRAINPFISGDVETPFMLLSEARNFGSDVGLAGFLSDTDATELLNRGFLPEFPTDALGAITRLDNGFGGGDFTGFDVLLFTNLLDELVTGAGLGVDPLSGGTGFLNDLPLDMAGLSVFATLIPEDGTTFSAAFGDIGIFDVELARGETQFIAAVAAVPVPAALPLLGSVLIGFGVIGWRKRRPKDVA